MTMQLRQLGATDLFITPIGFGAWGLGGANWFSSKGEQDDLESTKTIHRAIDLGINWIDTAHCYGLGHSEEVIGRALRGLSERPYVFTKCGIEWNDSGEFVGGNLSPKYIRLECEDSLRRLEMETIDLYQIHKPWPDEGIEDAWSTLADLKREGKVRHIGVTTFDVNQIKRIMPISPIMSLQPRYSILWRDPESEILPFCQQQNIGVIVYSPMANGLLSGKVTREYVASLPANDPVRERDDYKEPRISQILDLVGTLREIGQTHHRSIGEVAVAWVLRQSAVTGAISGLRRPVHVDAIVGAAELRLHEDEIALIDSHVVGAG
jgi:aryl-alcohol dehydrogenase-like predicted oxidoreductase